MILDLQALVKKILDQYKLPINGIHGVSHWARVYENGLKLAQSYKNANEVVILLFALFHDSKRENEKRDFNHGLRGAIFAESLRHDSFFELSDEDFEHLYTACQYHTDGRTSADITVQICWDADRLDLLRANIEPKAEFLCSDAAKQQKIIRWANQRSSNKYIPNLVCEQWGIGL